MRSWVEGGMGFGGGRGVCLRCASPFGQPVAGYLPLVGSRSGDGYGTLAGRRRVGVVWEELGIPGGEWWHA